LQFVSIHLRCGILEIWPLLPLFQGCFKIAPQSQTTLSKSRYFTTNATGEHPGSDSVEETGLVIITVAIVGAPGISFSLEVH
jgi:hypothetical protein